ncbi:hypothetical protein D3C87_1598410 [compost metagenome]
MLAGIDSDALKGLVSIISITVFDTTEHIVGEGIVQPGADRVTAECLFLFAQSRRVHIGPRSGPSRRSVRKDVVKGVTDTATQRPNPVQTEISAKDFLFIPVALNIALYGDTEA